MSDTQRTYTGVGRAQTFGVSKPRRRGPSGWWLLFILVAVAVAAAWLSRDTYEMGSFVAGDSSLRVTVKDAMAQRALWADTPLWDLLPEDHALHANRDTLREELPVPEWLAKNVFNTRVLLVFAQDAEAPVVVSRMTRTGTLAARALRWAPGVQVDPAGGLDLRTLDDGAGFFAVRGRVLVASASRRALIDAITLAFDETVLTDPDWDPSPGSDSGNVFGVATLDATQRDAVGADRVRFSVDLDASRMLVTVHGVARAQSTGIAALVANAPETEIAKPYPARAAIALNLGTDLEGSTLAIADVFGKRDSFSETWQSLKQDGDDASLRAVWSGLAALGPELHLSVHGVDANEVMPVPEIVLAAPGGGAEFERAVAALPVPSAGPGIDAVHASYDPARRYLVVPMAGGDSFEPSAAWHGDRFVFSTSKRKLDALLQDTPISGTVQGPYRAYVQASPGDLVDLYAAVGEVLVADGLLDGYETPAAFREAVENLRRRASTVTRFEAGIRDDGDGPTLECQVRFAAQ